MTPLPHEPPTRTPTVHGSTFWRTAWTWTSIALRSSTFSGAGLSRTAARDLSERAVRSSAAARADNAGTSPKISRSQARLDTNRWRMHSRCDAITEVLAERVPSVAAGGFVDGRIAPG